MMSEDKYIHYSTSDIYFSAYLCALDIYLEGTSTEDEGSAGRHKKVNFIFKIPSKDMQRLKASYFGGTGTVKAAKFVDELRRLKSMCFV